MELYLNYIFLWNNSYGVEAAAQWYFGVSAKDLDIVQSAILASLPKAPWRYDPFRNRGILMWVLSVKDVAWDDVELTWDVKISLYAQIAERLMSAELKPRINTQEWLVFLEKVLAFDATINWQVYAVTYTVWRKDISLWRMYERGMISQDQLKTNFMNWFEINFQKWRTNIKAPHFSMRIKELLEKPWNKYLWEYGEDALKKWWLVIRTSLDYEAQSMAENAVKKSIRWINAYGASNTSLIHLDSQKWEILAYVWSADYYNDGIEWKNDMIRAPLQPWSSIKPFFYALGFMKLPLTLDTDIFDIKFKIWPDEPQNVDGKFNGEIPLRKALASSRNIPAIKMYFSVWEDKWFIDFVRQMGVTSLNPLRNYAYPLAIWAWDMTMLELATMYAHLSANWRPAEIDPILDIKTADWRIVYKRSIDQVPQVIPSWVAYLIRSILSDPKNLPPEWLKQFTFPGIKFAHKTWTTNVRTKDDKRLPKDWRLATYTPSKVTIFWAWNSKPRALKPNAFWWWMNNLTRKSFWWDLKKSNKLENQDMTESETKEVVINRFTWKLATDSTPMSYRVKTLAYIGTVPTQLDDRVSQIQVDSLCMWKVSDLTPAGDIATAYISRATTFMPNKMDLNDIGRYMWLWRPSSSIVDGSWNRISSPIFFDAPTQECTERQFFQNTWVTTTWAIDVDISTWQWPVITVSRPAQDASVSKSFALWYRVQSRVPISTVVISVNDQPIWSFTYNKPSISDMKTISLAQAKLWNTYTITIQAIDAAWQSTTTTTNVVYLLKDTNPPYIIKDQIKFVPNGSWWSLTLVFWDQDGAVKNGTLFIDSKEVQKFSGSATTLVMSTSAPVSYSVSDEEWNVLQWTYIPWW